MTVQSINMMTIVLAISHDLFGSLVFVSLFCRINSLCELVARY